MKLFPKPQSCDCTGQTLSLTLPAVFCGEFEGAAAFLRRCTRRICGISLPEGGADAPIGFYREKNDPGAYRMEITDDGARIFAGDDSGAAAAAAKLAQLLSHTRCTSLPHLTITDAPYKSFRGVHMYMPGRKGMEDFCRVLDLMALLGMNTLILEVGAGMEYERHPEINTSWEEFCRTATQEFPGIDGSYALQWADKYWKDSVHTEIGGGSWLTKDEVRSLLDYARSLGIEVIPEIQALSHCYYMTIPHKEIAELSDDPFPDSYCPLNEDSYRLYFDLADEVLEVFRPRTVSVGHDEVRILGQCPRCRDKSGHELLAYELCRLHSFYAARGIRMAMWAETLQNVNNSRGEAVDRLNPYGAYHHRPATNEAIDIIPNDILMLDWYHSHDMSTEDCFCQRGMELIYGNIHGNLFAHWETRSRKPGVLGAEFSTWCVPGEDALAYDGLVYELLFTAAMLWESDYEDARYEQMRGAVLDFIPTAKAILHGCAAPSFDGSATRIWQAGPQDHPCSLLMLEQAKLPDTARARTLSVFGDLVFGVSIDTAWLFMECDFYARSLMILASAKKSMPYIQSYRFPQRKQWDLGTIALFYEDGTVALANSVYGRTVGCVNFNQGRSIATRPGAETAENSQPEPRPMPYYRHNSLWHGSLAYDTTIVSDGKTTAFAYEWINPHPEKRIVKLKVINASQDMTQSVILYGIAAIR